MTQPRLLGGRYELDGVVGRGGMAEVYRARDIRLDRIVAVKTLRSDLARDQTFQARFRREAQSAASLNHPSIVAVYDTGEDMAGATPVPYIVMEYVEGRTLRDLLRDDRRLLPERAMEITDGVLRALEYSHRNGIVHRDIKPGNVMLTRTGEVKVMDFGIARAVSDAQATMTQTAQVIGTAQYLSPEQARGERVDARSDLYSTGCLLYELLTGRPPFTGDTPVAIAYQHVRENPIPPSRLDPEVPAWADAITLKAMAKDPAYRYQSAGEMRTDIQRALSGMPVAASMAVPAYQGTRRMTGAPRFAGPTSAIPAYGYGPPEEETMPPGDGRRRRGWLWVLVTLLVLALIAAGIFLLRYISGTGGQVSVPSVTGLKLHAAEAQIRRAHLRVGPIIRQNSSAEPAGDVLSTKPSGGTSVAKNTAVTLYVSKGAAKIAVPSVLGDPVSTATSLLRSKGFVVAQHTAAHSTQPKGTVVKQNPAAGAMLSKGSTVTVYVSGGGVTIPPVIGDSLAQAQQALGNLGLQVNPVTQAGPGNQTPGTVWKSSPPPTTVVPPGSTVTIYVQPQASPSPTSSSPPSSSSSPSPSGSPSPTGHHGTRSASPGRQRLLPGRP
jgi:beta-lactam-binding protein with PASTA domain/tRNA A-37 threonylcarbamoyl transferase component Bud32